MKTCKTCKVEKSLDEYTIQRMRRDGITPVYVARCKSCVNLQANKKYASLTIEEKKQRYLRQRLRKGPEKLKDEKLRSVYGITLDDYKNMLTEQENKCRICSQDLLNPQVDHCHDTGKVRGILCKQCNTGLGLFRDDVDNLKKAIEYLA